MVVAENLKVTHFSNGDSLPNVTDDTIWPYLTTGAYCEYDNDVVYITAYGRLYNWYAVNDSRKIAPAGWHVATDADWNVMASALGGTSVAGGKMKATGFDHWSSPNTGATNESGFSALPGGSRQMLDGLYNNLGTMALFWTSSEDFKGIAWGWALEYNISEIWGFNWPEMAGYSVRCIRD
jgi:uncharacterized protein (TIGR02145 family)